MIWLFGALVLDVIIILYLNNNGPVGPAMAGQIIEPAIVFFIKKKKNIYGRSNNRAISAFFKIQIRHKRF